MLLDASSDRKIIGKVFGGRPVDDLIIGADANVRTVALIDGTWAKGMLVPALDAKPAANAQAAQRLHEIREFVTMTACQYGLGRVLVGCAKAVWEAICTG